MNGECAKCGQVKRLYSRKLCRRDYRAFLAARPTTSRRPLSEFVADYRIYRGRGMTHKQIEAVMGYERKTVSRLCNRARRAGLLPRVVTR